MTLSDVINIWITGRAPTTQYRYRRLAERLDAESQRLFKKSLLAVKPPELLALFRGLNGCDRTKAGQIFIIKSLFTTVIELELRPDNPTLSIKAPKFEDRLAQRIIKHEQVQQVIAAARCDRDRLLMQLMYNAGLRVSEAVNLKTTDVLGNGVIQVWGKGQKLAYVRIQPELETRLLERVKTLPEGGYLFPSPYYHDKPLVRGQACWIVKQAAKRAGLPKVSPHWFRHAHATEALQRGADVTVVKESLRHKSLDTTMRYVHISPTEGSALFLPPIE